MVSALMRSPSRRNRSEFWFTPLRCAYVLNTFSMRVVFLTLKKVCGSRTWGARDGTRAVISKFRAAPGTARGAAPLEQKRSLGRRARGGWRRRARTSSPVWSRTRIVMVSPSPPAGFVSSASAIVSEGVGRRAISRRAGEPGESGGAVGHTRLNVERVYAALLGSHKFVL